VVFSEFFCSIFLLAGLFTRLVVIPMIVGISVAIFKAHNGEIFGDGEHAALFLTGFLVLLIVGPGKLSVDGMMGK
jgi:putative oxidoreductase